jgi:hypothetical protein
VVERYDCICSTICFMRPYNAGMGRDVKFEIAGHFHDLPGTRRADLPPAPPRSPRTPPDHHQEEYTFDRLGVRVPAILVSP